MGFVDEIVVWLAKRAIAKIMNLDQEIEILRRRCAADPSDVLSLRRLRVLEARAGHDSRDIQDLERSFNLSPSSYIRVIEGFDRHNYVPGSLEVWTHNQEAVRDSDYRFNERTSEFVWLAEPSIDQQIIMTWKQWEPLGDEPEGTPPPRVGVREDPEGQEGWYG